MLQNLTYQLCIMKNKEYCIMPINDRYSVVRFPGSERHEVFEGRTGNRDKSIEDGLVVFITPEKHRTDRDSIHLNPKNWIWLKELAEKTWCEFYNKTPEQFRKRYGRNYI